MASTLVLGATGMTGVHILSSLLSFPSSTISQVSTISRRSPQTLSSPSSSQPTTTFHTESDTSKWSSLVTESAPRILFSALATTRAAAGSFSNQYAIEHDLNISLARAAKDAGTKTYVLISSSGAKTDAYFAYPRMKGEIERDILELGFEHTVILRPGLIGGRREESRPTEAVLRWVADMLGSVSGGWLKDGWTQDADVIGRAAVRAGLKASRGEMIGSKTVLSGGDILQLGRANITDQEEGGN